MSSKPSPDPAPRRSPDSAPRREGKPKRRAGVFAVSFVVIVVLAGLAAAGGWFWLENQYRAAGPLATETDVIIEKGAGTARIARELAAAGIIADARVFRWGNRLFGGKAPLRAGEYRFPAAISAAGAAQILQSGRTVQRKLTIAEGLMHAEVRAELLAAPGLTGALGELPEEGWLLPETYHYAFGDARADVVTRMHDALTVLLAKAWAGRAEGLPFKTAREALILASIVEKETGVAAERAHVAGVFVNRLKRGMRLQSDPTVAYGVTGGKAPLDRPLTRNDLDQPTRFNTYVNKGLPPTPIANPGRAAIEAVLHPMATDDLYFVADGTGGHAFAKTLKEHNANVAKWRRIQRSLK